MSGTNEDGNANVGRRELLKGAALIAGGALTLGGCGASPKAVGEDVGATSSGATPDDATSASTGTSGLGRRKLGALEVSAIGIGVQNVSRTFQTTIPSRPEMLRILRTAYERGVTFFDTAEVYGPHECERILGEAMASFRDDIVVATKFGFNVDLETGTPRPGLISKPEHIKRAVEGSLNRLRTDRVDLLYQHRVDPTVPIEDVAEVVADLQREGKVLHWGLSEMGVETLRRAHTALPVSAVQNEYSMVWRGSEQAVLPACRELGIGFVPFSPLGYGFLTGAIDATTTFAPGDFRAGTSRMSPENLPHNLALVEVARTWSARKQVTPGQIALAWLLAKAPWIVPIPGTTQMHHLLENIGSTTVSFTSAELTELDQQISAIVVRGERMPPLVQSWSDVDAPPKQ